MEVFKKNMLMKLGKCHRNPEKLVSLLGENSVIAGSFILDCINDTDNAGDIDIFTAECDVWKEHFIGMGCDWYHARCSDYEVSLNGIMNVFESGKFNIICCKSIKETIGKFDMDICQVNFDGNKLDREVPEKITILTPFSGQESHVGTRINRVIKYYLRGFKFTNLGERLDEYILNIDYSEQILNKYFIRLIYYIAKNEKLFTKLL